MTWLWLSAVLMLVTAVIHSVAGEKRIISPLLALGKAGIPSEQSRRVMRSAWHLTSAFMVTNAVIVVWPASPTGLITVIAAFWLLVGLFSLFASHGRHVGWPTLVASGVAALIGVYL